MLVNGEEDLGNLGSGVNSSFFNIVWFTHQDNGARGRIFDYVRFSRLLTAENQA